MDQIAELCKKYELIVTNDKEMAEQIKVLRNYESEKRYHNKIIGMNSGLDELQAGLLRVRLKHIEEITQERERLAERYENEIRNVSLTPPKKRKDTRTVWHQYVVRAKKRDTLQAYLNENGIGTIIHYSIPPHLSEAYKDLEYCKGDMPITEQYAREVLSLPIYNGMNKEEQNLVIKMLNKYSENES